MATDKLTLDAQKQVVCSAGGDGDSAVQIKMLQVHAKCGPNTAIHHQRAPAKVLPIGQGHQHISSTGLQTSSPSVVVIAKVATTRAASVSSQPQVTKPAMIQAGSVNQATTPGRTVVIAVPRSTTPQPISVTPQLPQTSSPQLPANFQIPPGMMLIRSDSGQLMLVSQQALAEAQQGPRSISGQMSRLVAPQVPASAGNKSNEKVTLIRMAAPPTFQQASVCKTAVVKVIGVAPKPAAVQSTSAVSKQSSRPHLQEVAAETRKEPSAVYTQETLESVKKCKNFLTTLIKLASSDSRSANMANNVRGLVQSLLEGKLEAEEFTEQLYQELKTTPQPCLVPFLKKSLPAVRRLTADPQLFIQQASTSTRNSNSPSSRLQQSSSDTEKKVNNSQQQLQGVSARPGLNTLVQSRNHLSKNSRPASRYMMVHMERHNKGQALGITDVEPDVVALVSHATQEYLRALLEKLTLMAEHRKPALKEDSWHAKVSDVRSQIRFLEEVESLKKKRKDEEERERLLRLAKNRSHSEDPLQQQLKQRAKELQRIEEAQLQQREANLTALAAIGPRKKRPLEQTESQMTLLPRQNIHRVTRVMLRDLLVCMEQDQFLRHSLTLYKAML
ncbi:transcription initiation factor TFIID subunit 4-like isoform X3 [Cheilinus undulatus]|uniref:transcription initiation factor TFIID subunit 4-like isoform X3 n=1 Tax=Cheilinus undulatus TaxID=241271 RepID=UPI001BD4FCE8|nr:transcription initiation factor TFIID subunit 4-like isoform X3 [Cheilinus undulatus]